MKKERAKENLRQFVKNPFGRPENEIYRLDDRKVYSEVCRLIKAYLNRNPEIQAHEINVYSSVWRKNRSVLITFYIDGFQFMYRCNWQLEQTGVSLGRFANYESTGRALEAMKAHETGWRILSIIESDLTEIQLDNAVEAAQKRQREEM